MLFIVFNRWFGFVKYHSCFALPGWSRVAISILQHQLALPVVQGQLRLGTTKIKTKNSYRGETAHQSSLIHAEQINDQFVKLRFPSSYPLVLPFLLPFSVWPSSDQHPSSTAAVHSNFPAIR